MAGVRAVDVKFRGLGRSRLIVFRRVFKKEGFLRYLVRLFEVLSIFGVCGVFLGYVKLFI